MFINTNGRATTSIDHCLPPRRNLYVNEGKYRKMQVMQLARNGYVRVVDERGGRRKQRIGRWRMGHSGVAFDIPVHVTSVGPMRRKGGGKRAGGGGTGNDDNDWRRIDVQEEDDCAALSRGYTPE